MPLPGQSFVHLTKATNNFMIDILITAKRIWRQLFRCTINLGISILSKNLQFRLYWKSGMCPCGNRIFLHDKNHDHIFSSGSASKKFRN